MAILTISKEFGSDGTQIGQLAAKLLNYEFIPLKKIHEDARKTGKQWERAMEDYAGGYTTLWEKYDWSFMGFVALSQSIIFNYAMKDNAVIMARGGNILLRGIPHCLRIRIIAPFEKRVETIAEREDITIESSRRIVEKADREQTYAVNQMYGKKGNDPETYDLIFNTELLHPEDVAHAVRIACIEKEAGKTEEALKILRLRALAYEVKAGIATNPHFLVPTLEVIPGEQGLFVRAVVRSTKKYQALQEEVLRLAGDVPVTFDLRFRGDFHR
ncbi:MAG: cytidylate kinase [Syntrophus sp. PtaU1.Bin208]|nr:MAG: cytidylate kinase [Syntrophus sp. PtaU1.Bin208]